MSNHRAAGSLQRIFQTLAILLLVPGCSRSQDSLEGRAPGLMAPALLRFVSQARAALPAVRAASAAPADPVAGGAESAVWAFRDAFVRKDLAAYSALLADDFVFVFRREDVGPGEPDTLDRAGEIRFADHLFHGGAAAGAPAAESIELRLEILERGGVRAAGALRYSRFDVMTHLRVHLPRGQFYNVDSPVRLVLRREGAEVPVWRLVEWEELPGLPAQKCALGGATR